MQLLKNLVEASRSRKAFTGLHITTEPQLLPCTSAPSHTKNRTDLQKSSHVGMHHSSPPPHRFASPHTIKDMA